MARRAFSSRRRRIAGGLVAAIGAGAVYSLQAAVPELIRQPTPPRLHRGLNLDDGFGDGSPPSARQLDGIRRAGFDHVRLQVDPFALDWRPDAPLGAPVFAAVGRLDAALDAVRAAGLIALLDFRPGDEAGAFLKTNAERTEPLLTRALGFLANRYRHHSERTLCFEVASEPDRFCPPEDWNALQGRLIRAMRVQAPRHWLIANGAWDPVSSLRTIDPYPDRRILYGFHFAKPYAVTRRNEEREPATRPLAYPEGVPYPSDLLDLDRLAREAELDDEIRARLAAYRNENWNLGRIRREIAFPADWSAENHVPVLCTELGALPDRIDPASRLRWLSDVTRALDERGIPWTVRDTCVDAGPGQCGRSGLPLDAAMAKALRLTG